MNKNKEELLNELKQLEKDFNTKVADIKKQIEECDKKVFKPSKFGEKYYTIFANGDIFTYNFFNSDIDKEFINFGNYFKTKEEAERKCFEIRLHRKLELFALENNENEIDWNNTDKNKYYIYYSYDDNCLDVEDIYDYRDFGQVYFTSEEIAEKAIETFKYDLIRYFTSNR